LAARDAADVPLVKELVELDELVEALELDAKLSGATI
jgi:hypothetical protein